MIISVVMDNLLDEQLVADYLNGNRESLEFLIRRYITAIYLFAYRYLRNEQDAEDIAQEVFVKVWRNLKKFNPDKNFKTWIFSIAKNSCLDLLKKKLPIPFSEFEDADGVNMIEETLADPAPSRREKISASELKNEDSVVIIGKPNEQGQIEASVIRVFRETRK